MIYHYLTCDHCGKTIDDVCYTADFTSYQLDHANSGIKFNLMRNQELSSHFTHPAYRKLFCKNCVNEALKVLGIYEGSDS